MEEKKKKKNYFIRWNSFFFPTNFKQELRIIIIKKKSPKKDENLIIICCCENFDPIFIGHNGSHWICVSIHISLCKQIVVIFWIRWFVLMFVQHNVWWEYYNDAVNLLSETHESRHVTHWLSAKGIEMTYPLWSRNRPANISPSRTVCACNKCVNKWTIQRTRNIHICILNTVYLTQFSACIVLTTISIDHSLPDSIV